MSRNVDIANAIADSTATVALAVLGWRTGSPWWWTIAAAWAVLTTRQISVTIRAARYRRNPPQPPNATRA